MHEKNIVKHFFTIKFSHAFALIFIIFLYFFDANLQGVCRKAYKVCEVFLQKNGFAVRSLSS
jgi:hypothetical protein